MKRYIKSSTTKSPSSIAQSIQKWVKKLSKDPIGNQNCMLCTWAAEQQFRGLDVMPRAVYSPRDPIFSIDPRHIVKHPIVVPNMDVDKLKAALLRSGDGARYYVHVNWAGSSGGHEFIALNNNDKLYILDAQSGTYAPIDSPEGMEYFDNINPENSYTFRMDNKELNEDYLKLNEDNYRVDWDEEADIKFMEENGMI